MLGWLKVKPFVLDEPVNGTFWPELEPNSQAIGDYGTGYYNVMVVDTDISMTGYRFDYIYFDEDGHFRNVERAARLFNNRFSGVAYVRRGQGLYSDGRSPLWVYFKYDKDDQQKYHFSAKTLRVLKKKAEQRGVPWEILHREAYDYICEQEELYL